MNFFGVVMKQFNFAVYKSSKQYFKLYDIYLKYIGKTKEELFDELSISNSSYRRGRDSEKKVGQQIINNLSKHYGFKFPQLI